MSTARKIALRLGCRASGGYNVSPPCPSHTWHPTWTNLMRPRSRRRADRRRWMMNRVRVQELTLVAVAGSLLAFEVMGLAGALPGAMRSLAGAGVLDAVNHASRGAAVATASMLDGVGSSAADVAVGAAK